MRDDMADVLRQKFNDVKAAKELCVTPPLVAEIEVPGVPRFGSTQDRVSLRP